MSECPRQRRPACCWQGGKPASVPVLDRVWLIITMTTRLGVGDGRKESLQSKHPT